ncbi:MAG: type VII secretion protein EssC [Bacilli bacterium]|nr:type VII secretion protein EssC [Bacilli bacterium]
MIIRLIKRTKIYNFNLPAKISGNYWITDIDSLGNIRNLVNIEEDNGNWLLKSNFETKIVVNNKELDSVILREYSLYFLRLNNENDYILLYCSPSIDTSINRLQVQDGTEIIIGNGNNCHINYNYPLVSKNQARLIYKNNTWYIEDLQSKYGTYVNNDLTKNRLLSHGDIIFIMGLKIIVLGDSIIINNIGNLVKIDSRLFKNKPPLIQPKINDDKVSEENIEFYKEGDYFFRSPRFKAGIENVEIKIDAPPAKEKIDDTPIMYVIGPMLSMGMSSLVMVYSSINNIVSGNGTIKTAIPSIVMAVAMLLSMILWPILNRNYQKKKQKKNEKLRQEKYKEYVENKRQTIHNEMENQRQVLTDNNIALEECYNIIINRKRNLWERELDQSDFLDLRLGIGNTEFCGVVKYPEEKFSLEDDNLQQLVLDLGRESKELENVPISFSFMKNNITAIIGEGHQKQAFINGLILQIMAFHSYEDLKIVLLTNEKNKSKWDYLRILPHCWNNLKTTRYFAANNDEAKELSLNLEQIFQERKFAGEKSTITKNINPASFQPYFFIIIDDFKSVRDLEIIKDICDQKENLGFSLMIINNRITNLPNECHTFISIGDTKSGIFENELVSNKQKEFVADFNVNIDMYACSKALANIPIEIAKENSSLPTMISFLEMYNVGKIEQLNILKRWENNDPTKSLQAPIGVDKNRELFKLDLHEKFYGPHGLIAGMTGSGKSELIITYILSMAVNYSPYEVSFILIDYKGGGLTGAFQNKETGLKLPHLAGTITNLDTVEMNRSLASIQSELRRRQRIFNEARDNLNESTIDIYKYQRLYREGLVKEPVSHLLIISDEFAELKDQQPEFMDQLISTARIGRSLGVHLILATQKPAGVVNDQIWSNSKFRICLKVQDKGDSIDMIKCPDAASLKETGRFYLQVGYNELFALGQSAWSGAKYYPTEKRKKKIDERIDIIDDVGNIIKSVDSAKKDMDIKPQGEEITNIVKYIVELAKAESISIKQLWLDRIPEYINIEDIRKKYHLKHEKFNLNPIIGEFDDPNNQRQEALTLPLTEDGNTIIYGSTGSGKELMINSIIYSLIICHSPEEVNIYALDFGAETLRNFKNAPQVGDIITSTDEEKVVNLYKFLLTELEKRKKLFINYNGDYGFYCKHSGKTLPTIIVIINNYDAYSETYQNYEETFTQICREGFKYGIIFIVTSNTTNSIRYKIRQNFKQNIVLQFNDPSDYSSILGNVRKKYPSKIYGRGLIMKDNLYEFQTAYPYESENMSEYLKIVSQKLNQKYQNKAPMIPILPEKVDYNYVANYLKNPATLPVGVYKDNFEIATINLDRNYLNIISANDISEYPSFIKSIYMELSYINANITVIDTSEIINKQIDNTRLIINQYDKIIEEIVDKISRVKNGQQPNNKEIILIIGLNEILTRLKPENKTNITNALIEGRLLDTFKFIIIENSNALKSLAYENWYKTCYEGNSGVWLGSGIAEQYIMKLTTTPRELREELKPGFGINVVKGKAYIMKLIDGENDYE